MSPLIPRDAAERIIDRLTPAEDIPDDDLLARYAVNAGHNRWTLPGTPYVFSTDDALAWIRASLIIGVPVSATVNSDFLLGIARRLVQLERRISRLEAGAAES